MKKLFCIFIVFCCFLALNASELFNLQEQDYQTALDGKMSTGKYKVNQNIIFETNLEKSQKNGYYYSLNPLGITNIRILDPIKNWKYNVEFKLIKVFKEKRNISLYDIDGNIFNLGFSTNGFSINEKEFEVDLRKKYLTLEIEKIDSKMLVTINNKKVYHKSIIFTGLKKIQTTYLSEYHSDHLYNMELYLK